MKTAVLLCAAALASPPVRAADPALSAEERGKVIRLLRESQKEFLALVENVSDAGWNYRPAPERWSVAEVAEHILLAERALFASVEKALAAPPNTDWEAKTTGKTEFIERVMPDRSRRAQAPETVRPQGLSRADILSRFQAARARTLKFIQETQAPLKAHTADHPFPVFGTLNAYQWILYIPLHNIRHNQQIAEVKASSGFPR